MRLIQPILLAGFLLSLVVYLRFLRSSLRDRLLAMTMFALVCAAVIEPDLTQRVATLVGVGRGTDLTLYVCLVAFVYFAVLTSSRLSRTDRTLTEVVRRVAILEGREVTSDARRAGESSPT
jgi:hypothetical protein